MKTLTQLLVLNLCGLLIACAGSSQDSATQVQSDSSTLVFPLSAANSGEDVPDPELKAAIYAYLQDFFLEQFELSIMRSRLLELEGQSFLALSVVQSDGERYQLYLFINRMSGDQFSIDKEKKTIHQCQSVGCANCTLTDMVADGQADPSPNYGCACDGEGDCNHTVSRLMDSEFEMGRL